MSQKKNTTPAVRKLMLMALLFLLCVVVMVGVTFARYQEEDSSDLNYNTRKPGAVYLRSDYTDGVLTGENIVWTSTPDGTRTAHFYIGNGISEADYSDEDLSVSIRLLASLSAAGAQVDLSVSDGSSVTTWKSATPVSIREGTPLHSTFGDGNTYIFYDDNGEELIWNLTGGAFSVLAVQVKVQNLKELEGAALLQLQVIGK